MAEEQFVPVCVDILVVLPIVDQSVFSALTVSSARLVFSKSVLILAQAHVEQMPNARWSITTPYVAA
jgi:hypothetical protein